MQLVRDHGASESSSAASAGSGAGALKSGTRLGVNDYFCSRELVLHDCTSRNVKRWQSGDMALRWTAAGMLEAKRQFRHIIGYCDLAKLATAVEREITHTITESPAEEADTLVTA